MFQLQKNHVHPSQVLKMYNFCKNTKTIRVTKQQRTESKNQSGTGFRRKDEI